MTAAEARVRERLAARRDELAALAEERPETRLFDLLRRVDSALDAVAIGEWGRCAVCHDPVEADRLEVDPLLRICLACLPESQRHALERDLTAAASTQRALLPPRRLDANGWEIAHLWEPHGAVSGDHIDVLLPADAGAPLQLLVGDVAGKGLAAALLQSNLHALFRALAPAAVELPALMGTVNRLLCEATSAGRYATFAALRLHADGAVDLSNAGHPRPLLADGRGVRPVEGASLPLGLLCEAEFGSRRLELRPGQTLLLYTDGWTEAERNGEEFGIGRASAALRRAVGLPLPDLLAACRREVEEFLAGAPRGDDLSLVAVRRGLMAHGGDSPTASRR